MENFNFDSKILSSSHLNFLFGAGVNGKAFPQMNNFLKTIELLEQTTGNKVESLEEAINQLTKKTDKEKVYKTFRTEFSENEKNIDYENESIKNLKFLFSKINKLVEDSENRTNTTKQINIFTLNYDEIVENSIDSLGYLVNTISSSNITNHDRFFNMVGYNYEMKKFVPTYLVSKIHGDINNPVLPGFDKFTKTLQANHFEILFKMKEKLSRMNSVLFVIGYSGNDEHINKLLKDCIACGLTVYWFKFSENDYIPADFIDSVFPVENKIKNDTTLLCGKMINDLWEKLSEE